MAYNKKYAELGESVIDYLNDREDAIEGAFLTAHEIFMDTNAITARWDSGFQIILRRRVFNGDIKTPHGSLYRNATMQTITYPRGGFVSHPILVSVFGMDGRSVGGYVVTTSPERVDYYLLSSMARDNAEVVHTILAVGRWK